MNEAQLHTGRLQDMVLARKAELEAAEAEEAAETAETAEAAE